ncbi:MAG TPA: hypothetical protein VGC81_09045 [Candidatus Methylomirabilis sp.]
MRRSRAVGRRTKDMAHGQPSCERLFTVCGESLLFQTNDESIMDAAIESFDCGDGSETRSGAPLVVQLFLEEERAGALPSPPDPPPQPAYRNQAHLLTISLDRDNTAVVDLTGGFSFGFVSPRMARSRSYLRYFFIEAMALSMLGPARGLIAVHASCVVKDGVSVMICAESGGGKSTLAMASVRRGFRLLADDTVYVGEDAGELHLHGLPCKLRIPCDASGAMADWGTDTPRLFVNGEWKCEVDLEKRYPGSAVTRATLGVVLFLEPGLNPGGAAVERLSDEEAADRLEVHWPYNLAWTETRETRAAALLHRGAYRLRASADPDATAEALDSFLLRLGTKTQ